jgi:hypothetical protein
VHRARLLGCAATQEEGAMKIGLFVVLMWVIPSLLTLLAVKVGANIQRRKDTKP